MKLAEALMLRADLTKKLASLRERLGANAIVQDGQQPHEDPNGLLQDTFAVLDEFEDLLVRINTANAESQIPDGRTLTQAIAARDHLAQQHSILQHAVRSSQKEPDMYSVREIKWLSTMDVRSLQKQSEDVARKLRQLNATIQETNWQIEL